MAGILYAETQVISGIGREATPVQALIPGSGCMRVCFCLDLDFHVAADSMLIQLYL